MRRKIFLALVLVAMLVCALAISVSATTPNNEGETFKAADGTVLALYDTDGKALAWFYDSSKSEYVPYRVGIDFTMALNSNRELLPTTKISDTDGDDSTSFPYAVSNMILMNGRDYKEFTYISGTWSSMPIQAIYVNNTFRWINKTSFNGNNSLRVFDIPKDHTGTLHIGPAFVKANALESFYIPKEAYFEGTSTFEYSTALKSVEFHDEWTGALKGYEFNGCPALETVILPSNIEVIAQCTFYGCKALTEFTVPASVKTLGYRCFRESGLVTITFSNSGNLTKLDGAVFENCKSLSELHIPEGVTYLGTALCLNASSMTKLTLPSTLTTLDGSNHFWGTGLTEVNGLENTKLTVISHSMFRGLTNWKPDVIKLPNTVAKIDTYGFADVGVKKIILGENTVTINNEALTGCKSLVEIVLPAGLTTINFNNSTARLIFVTSTDTTYLDTIKSKSGANGVVSYADYIANPSNYESGKYVISGYNVCDAFYNGEHRGESTIVIDDVLGYFGEIGKGIACDKCKETKVTSTINPIFTWKGYSAPTYGDGYSVVQGFYVDQDAIAEYMVYAPDFNYGILATVNKGDSAITPKIGDENVLTGNFSKTENDYLDIKVTGIPATDGDTKIVFCVYVTVGEDMYYLDNEQTSKSVLGISYNSVVALNNKGEVTE